MKCLNKLEHIISHIHIFINLSSTNYANQNDIFRSVQKEKYFIEIKGFFPAGSVQLIIFNDDEVKQVVYDAVIVSSSKRLLSAKDVIKRLNGVNSSSKCNY